MWRYDLDKFGVKLPLPVERFRYSERYWTVGTRKMGFQSSSWGPKKHFFQFCQNSIILFTVSLTLGFSYSDPIPSENG